MTRKVALTLDEKDLIDLEMIVRDEDQEAALDFARDIKRRADAALRTVCGQGVMGGSQPA